MRKLLLATIASTAIIGGADAAIIDFGGLAGPNQSAFPAAYVEDGFTVTPDTAGLQQGTFFGNPEPSMIFGPVFAPIAGQFTVTGGTFVFTSLDYASNNGTSSFTIEGKLNGATIFTQNGLFADSGPGFNFSTLLSSSNAEIDTLIFYAAPGGSSLNIDNINLTEVPEPFSAALLGAGLLGLAAARRRKAA